MQDVTDRSLYAHAHAHAHAHAQRRVDLFILQGTFIREPLALPLLHLIPSSQSSVSVSQVRKSVCSDASRPPCPPGDIFKANLLTSRLSHTASPTLQRRTSAFSVPEPCISSRSAASPDIPLAKQLHLRGDRRRRSPLGAFTSVHRR